LTGGTQKTGGTPETATTGAEKRSTGIPSLDHVLSGGFPKGTSIVVFGSALSGMELLARQFWQQDANGSYFITDADPLPGMIDARAVSLEKFLELGRGERVIVDSLSSVILKYGIDTVMKFVSICEKDTEKRKSNYLFLVYKGLHAPIEEIRISRAADVFLELKELYEGVEIEHSLVVHKIRGMDVPTRAIPLLIKEHGLEISTTSRVV
jgi:KaiC/GvpD/RAD55 family RecA-like ATPase